MDGENVENYDTQSRHLVPNLGAYPGVALSSSKKITFWPIINPKNHFLA